MSKRKRQKFDDLTSTYDLIFRNALEDRERALDMYNDLMTKVTGSSVDYMTHGMTLAKFLELIMKPNAQLNELVKTVKKTGGDSISDEEADEIYDEIKKKDEP